jgi:hypothetical protein
MAADSLRFVLMIGCAGPIQGMKQRRRDPPMGLAGRTSGSHETPRWRRGDSNFWSLNHARSVVFPTPWQCTRIIPARDSAIAPR